MSALKKNNTHNTWHIECSTGFILPGCYSLSQTSENNTNLASNTFYVHHNII